MTPEERHGLAAGEKAGSVRATIHSYSRQDHVNRSWTPSGRGNHGRRRFGHGGGSGKSGNERRYGGSGSGSSMATAREVEMANEGDFNMGLKSCVVYVYFIIKI